MVPPEKLNSSFVQRCGSCVLASYGIASNHYTKVPLVNFFKDYCNHYKIDPFPQEETHPSNEFKQKCELIFYEKVYCEDFPGTCEQEEFSGLGLIKELHNTS